MNRDGGEKCSTKEQGWCVDTIKESGGVNMVFC